jgi:DNA-binding transcriptional LysR family regulator
MKAFVRVLETGSFSAAARQMNIGQPAVSKAVAQLESRLGVRLLMRSTRRLVPTEAGRSFHEHARRAVEAAAEAELVAQETGSSLGGQLRVSAGASLANLHIVPRLFSFLAEHPHLSLDLVFDDGFIDPLEEGVDLAVRVGALRDSSFAARKLAAGRNVVLAAAAYFERAGVPAAPTDLMEHTAVICAHRGCGDSWTFRQNCSEIAVKLSGRLRVSTAEGLRAATLSGVGVTIAPDWMFLPELAAGLVHTVLTEWSLPPSDIWAVFPTGRMISPKVRAFADFVEAEFRRNRWKSGSRPCIPGGNDGYGRLTASAV